MDTKRNILLVTYIILAHFAIGQVDVSNYKMIADDYLKSKFDKKFINEYSFQSFYITTFDSSYWNYTKDDVEYNNISDSFIAITFQYTFFSKELNFLLPFDITVNHKLIINDSSEIYTSIPKCVMQDAMCNLLTKDQAIKIAIQEKIKYSTDFEIEFAKPYNKHDYYWIIIGLNAKTNQAKNQRKSFKFYSSQQKIINARDGKVLTWSEYLASD